MRDFLAAHHWRSGMLFWAAPSGRNDLLHTFLVPNDLLPDPGGIEHAAGWVAPNIWLGVSIENARYTWRADVLREIPAAVRFISAEPLLGSLFPAIDVDPCIAPRTQRAPLDLTDIGWVIIGGESGPGARPFYLEHAREIIAACRFRRAEWRVDGVEGSGGHTSPAIFVKQLGASPVDGASHRVDDPRAGSWPLTLPLPLHLRDSKGGDWSEWPADLRFREFPAQAKAAA